MEGCSRNPRVSLLKKYDIPIEHLSYDYVENCTNKKELEGIVRILRSGEEGTYPVLLHVAEEQLRKIAPNSRVLRVEKPALKKESFTNEEWKILEDELLSWEKEMSVMDTCLDFEKQRLNTTGCKNLPEVRKVVEPEKDKKMRKENDIKKIKVETNTKNERIKSGDYAGWDKFDVDLELLKMDLEEEKKQEKNSKLKREMEKKEKRVLEKKDEPINIDADSYSSTEHQVLANLEKDKGNECFKSGDYNGALKYYNLSLKLCPTANAYNNRAMTYIKIKNYEEALKDCNEVLKREENNIKALHRRATAYQNLPGEKNNELALSDLLKVVSLEPSNRVAQNDLQTLKKKLNIQDVGKKVKMVIEESENGKLKGFLTRSSTTEKKCVQNDSDKTAVHKLPVTYYGPSTSSFQCEPQSMTYRMLSGPTFSGQVMCKCNSSTTRQNPLCHRCGEKLSRPKPKPKVTTKPASETESSEKAAINAGSSSENVNVNKSSAVQKELKKVENVEPAISEKLGKSKDVIMSHNEVKSKSALDKENEKSKMSASSVGVTQEINTKEIVKEEKDESKLVVDRAMNEKSDESKVDKAENEPNGTIIGNRGGKGDGSKEVNSTLKDVKNPNEFSGDSKKEVEASQSEKEVDRNLKFFEELDMSIKERKNLNNNQCKEISQLLSDGRQEIDNNKQRDTKKTCDAASFDVAKKSNETSDQTVVSDNDNQSLPCTPSQNESKPATKKSKNKKKKSKESKQDEMRLGYHEPVKVVQATKYLKPTRAEPKPESDSVKDVEKGAVMESKEQSKQFVPSKKGLTTGNEVLKSTTASYTTNVGEKECKMSPPFYGSSIERIVGDCEGNKENILEHGNECKTFEKFKNNFNEKGDSAACVTSSFEFMTSWEAMKKADESYEKRAEIVRLLRPGDLKTVIGNNLDSDMLIGILECLERHFLDNDPKKVVSILKELPLIPRFGIINLFLSSNERKVVEKLIDSTEKRGFVLDEEVKKSFKMSF